MKKSILAVIAVFITWEILDYVLHGILLQSFYQNTPNLWRPMAEMKTGLMMVVTFLASISFVGIYACLVSPKTTGRAMRYAILYGIGAGATMGYGSYSVMPIPYGLALSWFLGTLVEMLIAGAVVGMILKEPVEK